MRSNSIAQFAMMMFIALVTAGCNDRTTKRPSNPAISAVDKEPTATVSVTSSVPTKDTPAQQKYDFALMRTITDTMVTSYFFGRDWRKVIANDGQPADNTRFGDMFSPPCWKQNCPSSADAYLQLAATYLVRPVNFSDETPTPLLDERVRAAEVAVCNAMFQDTDEQGAARNCIESIVDGISEIDPAMFKRYTALFEKAQKCGNILGHANSSAAWDMYQTSERGDQAQLLRLAMTTEVRGGDSYYAKDPGFCTQIPQRHPDRRSARGVAAKIVATAAFLVPPDDAEWRSPESSIQLWGFSEMPWAAIEGDYNVDYRMTWKHVPWFYQDVVSLDEAWRYGAYAFSATYAVRGSFIETDDETNERSALSIAPISLNASNHAEGILCGAWAQRQHGPFTDDEAHERWLKICGHGGEHHFEHAPSEFQTYHAAAVRKFERCAEIFIKKNKATIDALTAKIQALDLPLSRLKDWGPITMLSSSEVVAFLRKHPVHAPKPSDFDEPREYAFCTAPTTPARGTL